MTHFPRETTGCYHQHIESCCWLCTARILVAVIGLRWRLGWKTLAGLAAGFVGGLAIALALLGLVTLVRWLVP